MSTKNNGRVHVQMNDFITQGSTVSMTPETPSMSYAKVHHRDSTQHSIFMTENPTVQLDKSDFDETYNG